MFCFYQVYISMLHLLIKCIWTFLWNNTWKIRTLCFLKDYSGILLCNLMDSTLSLRIVSWRIFLLIFFAIRCSFARVFPVFSWLDETYPLGTCLARTHVYRILYVCNTFVSPWCMKFSLTGYKLLSLYSHKFLENFAPLCLTLYIVFD